MYICLYRLVNSPYLLDFVVWNSIFYMEFQGHSQQALDHHTEGRAAAGLLFFIFIEIHAEKARSIECVYLKLTMRQTKQAPHNSVATRPKISIFCFIYKLVLISRLRRTAT
jgi:hypothetical protein